MTVQIHDGQHFNSWLQKMRMPRVIFSWYLGIMAAVFLGLLGRTLFLEVFQGPRVGLSREWSSLP